MELVCKLAILSCMQVLASLYQVIQYSVACHILNAASLFSMHNHQFSCALCNEMALT